jgi:hypothetical protein
LIGRGRAIVSEQADGQRALELRVEVGLQDLRKEMGNFTSAQDGKFAEFSAAMDKKFGDFTVSQHKKFDEFSAAQDRKFEAFAAARDKKFEDFTTTIVRKFDEFTATQNKKFDEFTASQRIQSAEANAVLSYTEVVPPAHPTLSEVRARLRQGPTADACRSAVRSVAFPRA